MPTEPGPDSPADNQLTLFIPTKDRSRFLAKLLKFYAEGGLRCAIHVGDASEEAAEARGNEEAVSRHRGLLKLEYERQEPGITTVSAVRRLLEKIQTPYAVFGGDDDYLIPAQLRRCVRFLQSHPDYTSVTGDQAEVFVDLDDVSFRMKVLKIVPGAHKEASHELPSKRLLQWSYPAIGKNTFSVQPIEALRWAWAETDRLDLDQKLYAPLHELSVNVLTVLKGKQKHLKGLYHVMLRHTRKTGFSGPVDYFDRIAQWDWPSKVVPAIDRWTREILEREALEAEPARRVAQTVFLQWLVPYLSRNRDRKLKEFRLTEEAPATLRQRLSRGKSRLLGPLGSYRRQIDSVHRVLQESLLA